MAGNFRTEDLAREIGFDMRLMIGRIWDIERSLNDPSKFRHELPDIQLPSGELPDGIHPATGSANDDLGFVDFALSTAEISEWDMVFDGHDLVAETSLRSAIIISVWTNAETDQGGGWWGDSFNDEPIADCKLYTLLGKQASEDNTRLGATYINRALSWLITDKWCASIEVSAEQQKNAAGVDVFAFKIVAELEAGGRFVMYL